MNWKSKEGQQVIFTGQIKALQKGTIGILKNVYNDWATILYPQNAAFEDDGKCGWKPIKSSPLQIYAHSVKLTDIKLVE